MKVEEKRKAFNAEGHRDAEDAEEEHRRHREERPASEGGPYKMRKNSEGEAT